MRRTHCDNISNQQILDSTDSVDVRIRLALDRLSYAQRMYAIGPEYLQHLEHQLRPSTSWLAGVLADLQWLSHVLPNAIPGLTHDITDLSGIDLWQQGSFPWKRSLRRAIR